MATTTDDSTQNGETLIERFRLRAVALYGVLGLLAVFYLTPLWSGFMTSIKTPEAFARTVPFAPPLPGSATIEPWFVAFEVLRGPLLNSLVFTIPAAAFSAVLGSMAAYGLTNVNWRGQVGLMALFIAAIFVPGQALLVPLNRFWNIVDMVTVLSYFGFWQIPMMWQNSEMITNIFKLIITHTAFGIGICTLLFRSYYLKFTGELMEAARLDGASLFSIYRNIILPLSKPMFAVVLIFQFTQIWNEFLYGLVIVGAGPGAPVTVALDELAGGILPTFDRQMAGAFIAALPTLIVYILFGEQFAEGVAGEST